jgi:hypothetical protein
VSGGYIASAGGYAFLGSSSQVVQGGTNWREAYNVVEENALTATTDTTAVHNSNRSALQAAMLAAGTADYPAYIPAGEYNLAFLGSYDNDADGRIRIAWKNAEIFGDGIGKTVISAKSRKDSRGRISAIADDTVASGRRSGALISTNTVQLAVGEAANFFVGAELYFSPNSNGSSPRTQILNGHNDTLVNVTAVDTTNHRITLSDAGKVSGFVANDYIFIKHRLTLQTAADSANFQGPNGTSARCEVYASPNADGSSPRAGAVHVVRSSSGVITFGNGAAAQYATWQAGDYLFVNVPFNVFEHYLDSTSEDEPWNLSIHDLTIDCEFYGSPSPDGNQSISGETAHGDIINTPIYTNNNANGAHLATDYTIDAYRCRITGGWEQFYIVGGTTSKTHLRVTDCETAGGRVSIFMGSGSDNRDRTLTLRNNRFEGTDVDDGSMILYISPAVSIYSQGNRYLSWPSAKFALQHAQSSNTYGAKATFVNDFFGSGGLGYAMETSEKGSASTEIVGCTFECYGAILARCSLTATGNTFRTSPDTGTPTVITTYADIQHNAHIDVVGNVFDFSRATAALRVVAYDQSVPCSFNFSNNVFTSSSGVQGAGAPVACTARLFQFSTGSAGNGGTNFGKGRIAGNICTFSTTSLGVEFAYFQEFPNVDIEGNQFYGRTTVDRGWIRSEAAAVGSGRVRIRGNYVEQTAGTGILYFAPTLSAAPTFEIENNNFIAVSSATNIIHVVNAGAFDAAWYIKNNHFRVVNGTALHLKPTAGSPTFEVSDNTFTTTGTGLAIDVSTQVAALGLTGSGNKFNTCGLTFDTNAQGLLQRRGLYSSTIQAAASISISADHDVFMLDDSGATDTIDTILVNGVTNDQLGFSGSMIRLIFTTANIALGNAGNIVAAGGARTIGTGCTLLYNHSAAKWIEV